MNLEDMLGGQKSAPSPKWNEVGDEHVGRITGEPKPVQQKDFKSGQAKYWQGNKPTMEKDLNHNLPFQPMLQIACPVTLKDGTEATFWIEGEKLKALRATLKEQGLSTIVKGGLIGISLVELKDTGAPFPKKLYAVKYKAPQD